MNKDLMANAFVASFDFSHPMLSDLKIFDLARDNVPKRLKTINYLKHVELATSKVKLQEAADYKPGAHDFTINYRASVNEIDYSTRLNSGFKKALAKSENLEELLRPIEKDY